MNKIQLEEDTCKEFERIATEYKIYLEGNILKVIEPLGYDEFNEYIALAKKNDNINRKKRLEVTKQVQAQNKELQEKQNKNQTLMEDLQEAIEKDKQANASMEEQNSELKETHQKNEALMSELKDALSEAENAKTTAQNDLDVIQKKTQFELIGNIVSYALYVIVGTGLITTALYVMAIIKGSPETTLIGSTWSNLFGILLTNSFSIIGTIMGVKYASKDESSNANK